MTAIVLGHGTAMADWIWQSADGPVNGWVAFRKTIHLPEAPAEARVRIASDTQYWLWVNGQMVVREGGLKRGPTPSTTYADELDLAGALGAGDNTIAVLVWHMGKSSFSHNHSGKGGLLMESLSPGFFLSTNSTWKVRQHPAHGNTGAPHPNYRLSESNISFNAGSDMPGWFQPAYDDSSWAAATAKGAAGSAPWGALAPRPIPFWKDYPLLDYANHAQLGMPFVATGAAVVAKLPHNIQFTPFLKIDAPAAGMVIDIRTDNYYGGGGNEAASLRAEYVTRAGVQEWEMPAWFNGHEVQYSIPAGIAVLELKYRQTAYDAPAGGAFSCDDPFWNRYWEKALRTLQVCMRENQMDCPERERAQWSDATASQTNQAFYTLGPQALLLTRKAFREMVAWRKNGDILYNPVPGNWTQELPILNLYCFGWLGLWSYYWQSGDQELLAEVYPHARNYVLNRFSLGGDGLVNHRSGDWDYQDWGTGQDVKLYDNVWYYGALKALRESALVLGQTADIPAIEARMASIEAQFDPVLWNSGLGAYKSAAASVADDRGNALAVVFGLAPVSRHPALRAHFSTNFYSTPHIEKFVAEALFLMGCPADGLARYRARFTEMVNDPITTLWENWSLSGWVTYNHAFVGHGTALLGKYVVGVWPTGAGYSSYRVRPQMGGLIRVNATVPSVRGPIGVGLERTPTRFSMALSSPATTTARACIPADFAGPLRRIAVNGVVCWQAGLVVGSVPGAVYAGFEGGCHQFDLQPGSWMIEAEADPAPVPPPPFATSRWKCDEGQGPTASDSLGGNHGALVSDPAWTTGRYGGALAFDGLGDHVLIGNGTNLNIGANAPFTVAGWLRTTEGEGMVVSFRHASEDAAAIEIGVGTIGVNTVSGALKAIVRQTAAPGSGGYAEATSAGTVNNGQWRHFALVRSASGTIQLHVDGAASGPPATGAYSAGAIATNLRSLGSARRWELVGYGSPDQRHFAGQIDDLRFYNNQALSPGEIAALADQSPYHAWVGDYPALTDISPAADGDRDGRSNLIEYAFGGDPTATTDPGVLDEIRIDAGRAAIAFQCLADRPDLTYTVQSSADLRTWLDVARSEGGALTTAVNASGALVVDPGGSARRVTVSEPASPTSYGRGFLRLRVATP